MITLFELSLLSWIVIIFCAMLIGFTKTGIASLGIFVVTILMFIFPAKASVGILLPMLIVGDIFAVIYYRRKVVWRYLFSLVPWVLVGIASGYLLLDVINSEQLKPLIGALVLILITLHVLRDRLGDRFTKMLPKSKVFTVVMGALAGFTTMIGNAAGGIMSIYLLMKQLPKQEFIGTAAWFFLFVNLIKVPLYIQLDLITFDSMLFNLKLIPAIVVGAIIGIRLLPYIPQKVFQALILIFSAIGGLRLLIG
ncbi:sulfite exporter TauE/SafE family protein [Bacillus salinus]|uniref:sulfite exporter TauE/SafE family protein n=1 Tax=Bacillus sp. HMF5848 TaxID=2495421 RepID=UPI002897930D|nr:sulfite exporter TauE/SafE family protein [Bacillus sp. HMF5848]